MTDKKLGIFQLVKKDCSSDDLKVMGTAFAISTLDETNDIYYLLTAYHVVSELIAKSIPIIVRDENNRCYSVTNIFPEKLSEKYRQFGQDYALLKLIAKCHYETYKLYQINEPQKCFVRGAVSNYKTMFTAFNGNFYWHERIPYQKQVLQLNLNIKNVIDKNNNVIPQQKILKGLSGSPILVKVNEEYVCTGVLGNLSHDVVGSLAYGVPITNIIEDCLNVSGIKYQSIQGEPTNIILMQNDVLIEMLIGDTKNFSFENSDIELYLWNQISNLFYNGYPIDVVLAQTIELPTFNYYSYDLKIALQYFYSRLLFKKGLKNKAFKYFSEVSANLSKVGKHVRQRIETLLDSRSIIETEIIDIDTTIRRTKYVGERISKLTYEDDAYIANELASLYGRSLSNLFSVKVDFEEQNRKEIISIYNQQKDLFAKYPSQLCKQDVVITSLKWFIGLWGIDKDVHKADLEKDIYNGLIQSKKRGNSIFYIQCIITYGILYLESNLSYKSVSLFLLAVKLMKHRNISIGHEGINQLLLYIKEKHISYYAVFLLAYSYQEEQGFIDKVALYGTDINQKSWFQILHNINWLYDLKYKNTKNLYDIDINEVLIYF